MNRQRISCIVPVHNGERYLGLALDSILTQIYRPFEIIVVDDGSTDGTPSVAARYGKRILFLQQAYRGSAAAKNTGIGAARGNTIAFLEADDLWHPKKLARQVARLRQRPEIDLCFTSYQNFWMPELREEERRFLRHGLPQPASAWSLGTLLARRSAIEKFGRFDSALRGNENMIWFLRAAGQGAVIEVLPDVLMYRRLHLNSDTRSGLAHHPDLFLPVVKAWRDYQRTRRSS